MTSAGIEMFLGFLRQAEQNYRIACEAENEENNATQDILHALELEQHSYHEKAKLAIELGNVRRRRRKAKDTIMATEPIVSWINENKVMIKSLERLLGEVRKAEKRIENRVYIPRSAVLNGFDSNNIGEANERREETI